MEELAVGVEPTSSPNVDTALTSAKDGLIETLRKELGIAKEQNDALEAKNKDKDGLIQQFQALEQQLNEEGEGSYQDYWNLQRSHDRESDNLAMEKKRVQEVQKELAVRNKFISNLFSQGQVLQQQQSTKETELKELQKKLSVLEAQDATHKAQIDTMQENLDLCRDALRTKDERITQLEAKVGDLVAVSTTKDERINGLHQQQASVVNENANIRGQAERLMGDSEQNHRLRAENAQLRLVNADLETTNGYHQRYINDLTSQKILLGTRVDGQYRTIASLARVDGKRQYEIKDLYHGYACLCVKARNEPVSKDVFRATSHARFEEDHPVDGPCQDSSTLTILSPKPVRPNPTWVHNESFEQLDLD
ncbi:MAG: hypothetical protein OHK93_002794 [Ramalina farinacea]|uniref:Uncharacterized protein n=1 Tax=Ramalina farinacea TaxID=258253 RepID=A0AA43QWJ8_9LECA|nr:hypothetical protein [Ramalina farinacea]